MRASLYAITFDCADAGKLASFWSSVLGQAVDDGATAEFASIGLADEAASRPHWMFIKVPEAKSAKNRAHVDLIAPDLDSEVQRLLSLGASHIADLQEDGYKWTTLADLDGNEFDVIAEHA